MTTPTSQYHQLNEIVELIVFTKPESVLDVGIGFGKYGFLAREYLDEWKTGRYNVRTHRIDGIEIYDGYLTPLHHAIYDHVFTGDASTVVPNLEARYDLALLIDVIEHFGHEEDRALLDACLAKCRNVIVSTPKDIGHQGEMCGNPHEEHRSQWTREDFARFPPKFFVPNSESLIGYVRADADRVKAERGMRLTELLGELAERHPIATRLIGGRASRLLHS